MCQNAHFIVLYDSSILKVLCKKTPTKNSLTQYCHNCKQIHLAWQVFPPCINHLDHIFVSQEIGTENYSNLLSLPQPLPTSLVTQKVDQKLVMSVRGN